MHNVTLINGDGVGPELAEVAQRCIDATGAPIEWTPCEAGVDIMGREGTPLPPDTIQSLENTKVALKAPITTPVGVGYESVNMHLRQHFDLFACIRPCKSYSGLPGHFNNVDMVVVRENTEGLYAGIEYEKGAQDTLELINWINANNNGNHPVAEDSGISIKALSAQATRRIVTLAFEYAKRTGRQKVTCAHKANIMKCSDGLWLDVSRDVAKKYPNIEFTDCLVDNLCMKFIQTPDLYDVIVVPNLYGDIISDMAAGLVGGLGMAASAHVGDNYAVFEALHGSVAKYRGQNKVNPTALILSGVLMLRHLGLNTHADRLEKAVAEVIAEGHHVTYDLKKDREDKTAVGTAEMGEAIIKKLS